MNFLAAQAQSQKGEGRHWTIVTFLEWGGAILTFGGLMAAVTYPFAVYYAAAFDRETDPLKIAGHAALFWEVIGIAFAVVYLLRT